MIAETHSENTPGKNQNVESAGSARALSLEQTDNLTPSEQTAKMEVHHHPHVGKKNFKEYLLEGLMIFIAVTLGFFAETTRESISEKHREKDYIRGLVNNVQNDTADLGGLINRNDIELKGIDSIMKIPKDNFTNIPVQDSIFYYALQYSVSLHLFQFHDITLVQLRNAGGYSLIKTGQVADSIALYESNNNEIKLQERFVTDYYVQTWNAFKQVFDGTLSNKFFRSYATTNKIPSDIPVLISKDKARLDLLYNNYWTYAIVVNGYKNMLKEHLQYLKHFLIFLKQNYDIE